MTFKKNNLILILIFLSLIITGCSELSYQNQVNVETEIENSPSAVINEVISKKENIAEQSESSKEIQDLTKSNLEVFEELSVHFIDVGQGDATLIIQGDQSMLIDGGDNQYGQTVVDYLKEQGITKLDYVIGTHPHADHIGGLSDVVEAFEIGKIIMPRVSHNTRTYENLLLAIKSKELRVKTPVVGDVYSLGESEFMIIAPSSDSYSNLNDYSVGIRLSHGDNRFIFTGDAEVTSEREMVNLEMDLSAEVLKIPHHGSSTSSTEEFFKAVNPQIGVFSLGADNRYGHPHAEIVRKYENIRTYRTDLHGTVIIVSNGIELSVRTEKESNSPPIVKNEENTEEISKNNESVFIGNKNSKIYHIESCSSLPVEHNRIYFETIEDAIEAGHRACGRCQ